MSGTCVYRVLLGLFRWVIPGIAVLLWVTGDWHQAFLMAALAYFGVAYARMIRRVDELKLETRGWRTRALIAEDELRKIWRHPSAQ